MQRRTMQRRTTKHFVIGMTTTLLALSPGFAQAGKKSLPCRDSRDLAKPITIPVKGEQATGHYALPSKDPATLVVVAHGYGHTSVSWLNHMRMMADEGALAVAMDYRGLEVVPDDDDDGLPESRGWPAVAGAEDSIAAAQLFEA
ncbi:MAG: hypothetical protein ABR505_05275, partial [Actinomycetota bacterium]